MDRIKKYVEHEFKDFPKTDEVKQLKIEMLENLNVKYQILIEAGFINDDAFNKLINDFGDILELKEEYGVNKIIRRKINRRILITSVSLFMLMIILSIFGFIRNYQWKNTEEVKIELINNLLEKEEFFDDIYQYKNKPYIITNAIEYETNINNRKFSIASYEYRLEDKNLGTYHNLPGLALIEYNNDFDGKINIVNFDYFIYNSSITNDKLKTIISPDKNEIIVWGCNSNIYSMYTYKDLNQGKTNINLPKYEYLINLIKCESTIDLTITPTFILNTNQEINANYENKIIPTTYYYGTRIYLFDEFDKQINEENIEDYTMYYNNNGNIFDLEFGSKLYATDINNWHNVQPHYYVNIEDDVQLFYPKSNTVKLSVTNLYKDLEGNIIEKGIYSTIFRPTDTNRELNFITIKQEYNEDSNIDNLPITLNLKINLKYQDPLKLQEYKVVELDKDANKIKETIIDYKQAINNVIEYRKSENCAELKVYQTFMATDNEVFTLIKVEPSEHLYYLTDDNNMEWFYVNFLEH